VSRLLIDLNRSLSNPHAWSEATRTLAPAGKDCIVRRHYAPYRQRVTKIVAEAVRGGRRVIHLSTHSFTPVFDGHMRQADIGLLYDPARAGEVAMAACWKAAFAEHASDLRVRRNYPYAGKNDGLTCSLRRRFPPGQYVGIEIELNQALVGAQARSWRRLRAAVITTLQAALR
jgi:predicted N-formylglutamate amidohydrolase